MKNQYEISISDVIITDKDHIDHKLIWRTMHPVIVSIAGLKDYIAAGHPFLCCKPKNQWNGQRLFGIDIDHFEVARGRYSFDEFIAVLDAIGLPPCMAYTTFSNPDRKRERFRLLFQLSEPVTDIQEAWKVSRFLFGIINELVPGAADKNCRRPYGLFYPGKKIILYHPRKVVRADILTEAIRETEKPHVIIKTTWAWTKIKQILEKDPFIPSVKFKSAPPGYLINLGSAEPWLYKYQIDIKTSRGISTLRLLDTNRICYNLLNLEKIIDIYYYSGSAVEQSEKKMQTCSMTVFEHYGCVVSSMFSALSRRWNCDIVQGKILCQQNQNFIFKAMGIHVIRNKKMIIPTRLSCYAKAIMDLSSYPNLAKIFRRDPRKLQMLASIILLAREISLKLMELPKHSKQYVITYQMIADKLRKKFHQSITREGISQWIKQFHDLHLIHICHEDEIASLIKQQRNKQHKHATVIQIPYFDQSVLIHAEIRAAKYKPPVIIASSDNIHYITTKNILVFLLSSYGWFSRDAFIRCVEKEAALDNTDGYTVENAATYFDRYIPQIQQELRLIKSSCTKQLITRFPGNHKIGLTKIYYRGET